MSFRISNILDYDCFIALDIGSFRVKALVCRIEGQNLKIVGSSSFRQNKKDMMLGEIADIVSVSNSIQKCISKACQGIEEIPKDIIVSFNSSEMVYDFTSINYVRKHKESTIQMQEIDEMIEDIELRSMDKVRHKTANRLGIIDAEMKLITTSLTGIYVDGQRVSNPVGFTGKNVKMNIINVFAPLSKYILIKNIIRDLNLNLISVVPLPICLPKLNDNAPHYLESNLYIDIGYSKITVILQNNSEILGFNVLDFGYALVEAELRKNLKKSYLDVEKMLNGFDESYKTHRDILEPVLDFLMDSIVVAIQDIGKSFYAKNVFLSGACINKTITEIIRKHLEAHRVGAQLEMLENSLFDDDFKTTNANLFLGALSLAKVGRELIAIKKDPLVRILRYVIYKYE